MARLRKTTFWNRIWRLRKRSIGGFTLIELLVSMIIGAIITVALLSLVVELTSANQKDAVRTEVQTDMQAAMDFITQDLREAIYVYGGDCLQGVGTMTADKPELNGSTCPGLVNHIPAAINTGGRTAALAFWRLDPLPDAALSICKNAAGANPSATDTSAAASIPCIGAKQYTLVVYAIDTSNPGNTWQGRSRLIRYQLPQFKADGSANPGYVNPLNSTEADDLRFQHWPWQLYTPSGSSTKKFDNQQSTLPTDDAGDRPVLVDFLDDKANVTPNCADPNPIPSPTPTPLPPSNPNRNKLTPLGDVNTPRGFYACVRGRGLDAPSDERGAKQEIVVSLAGNIDGKPGTTLGVLNGADGDRGRLPALQTRVLSRGILR